jgi:hypothetical protein
MLSVIYFPLCLVEVDRDGTTSYAVVDGVGGAIARLDAPPSLVATLQHAPAGEPEHIGFRPLTCPNCGWDLPVRPDDVVFCCGSCEGVFEIRGRELQRLTYDVAAAPAERGAGEPYYLPFWILDIDSPADRTLPDRLFVPAFRFRRLKTLVDLARDMSLHGKPFETHIGPRPPLHGCFYGRDDAESLAAITYPALCSRPVSEDDDPAKQPFRARHTRLTWLPFRREGSALRDPFTGRALNTDLLT